MEETGSGGVGGEVDILASEAGGVMVKGGEAGYFLLGAVAIFGHSQIKNANCKYLAIVKIYHKNVQFYQQNNKAILVLI